MYNPSWLLPLIIFDLVMVLNWFRAARRQRWQRHPPAATTMPPFENQQTAHSDPPRSPYNEDEIVQLIKDIYRTYLRLNYIKRWELVWPPKDTGHVINAALCEELGLEPAVVSLMKRIPYFYDSSTSRNVEFHEYSRAMVYLEDAEIRGGRDPDLFEIQEPRLDYLLPRDIALICTEDQGGNIILDTKANTIRVQDFLYLPPGPDRPPDYDYRPERVDDEGHYRNYYAHHAPTWLAAWLEKIKSLEFIPVNSKGDRSLKVEGEQGGAVLKDILQKKYGWPDSFREAEWRRAGSNICWQVGQCTMDNLEIPDEFEVDTAHDEEEAMAFSGRVAYAEEIDGPRGEL
ncbi:hypothetical protein BJY01DRAFT_251822 [Aspergillus pseudoustus]|uniref:Uncharacterized protein n=1 Tax=Aspergillus pseudoustus TaxID=1810923 RepID=A0ABR4JCB0_9EURO